MLEAADSEQALAQLSLQTTDLITLDLNLGSEDGLDLARKIRASSEIPIIMVSGKGELIDTVVGLEIGADDYISKPFELREVIARVRAVLRRYQTPTSSVVDTSEKSTVDTTFVFDQWILDCSTRELRSRHGTPVSLTTGEFDLLEVFVTHARSVLSRDQIMDALKGRDWSPNDRTIDNQVARLRKKLQCADSAKQLIKTVRGTGYLFTATVEKQ